LLVCLPTVSLDWPIIFWVAFLALSMSPMQLPPSSCAALTRAPVSFPGRNPRQRFMLRLQYTTAHKL
jgi:hypothetical protein